MKRFLKRLLCAFMLVFMSVVARPQAREGLRYAEPFSVEGLEVGTPVAPNSHAYKRYKCHPSEQYLNSVTCQFSEVKNGVSKHLTILHLYNEPLAKFIEGVIFDDSTRVAVVAGQVGAGRKAVTRNI